MIRLPSARDNGAIIWRAAPCRGCNSREKTGPYRNRKPGGGQNAQITATVLGFDSRRLHYRKEVRHVLGSPIRNHNYISAALQPGIWAPPQTSVTGTAPVDSGATHNKIMATVCIEAGHPVPVWARGFDSQRLPHPPTEGLLVTCPYRRSACFSPWRVDERGGF